MDDLRSFSVGAMAGMVAKVVEQPFDTVKVRLQTQVPLIQRIPGSAAPPELFDGAVDCVRKTMKSEGLSGLYRGLASPLIGSALESAILFSTYGKLKQYFIRLSGEDHASSMHIGQIALAGASTGLFTSLLLTPVELIKCRLQVQRRPTGGGSSVTAQASSRSPMTGMLGSFPSMASTTCVRGVATVTNPSANLQYTGTLNCIWQTIKSDGITGLFRGGMSTLLREVPGNAIWFGTYEIASTKIVELVSGKRTTRSKDGIIIPARPGPMTQIFSGALAGCLYWLIPYPIDTIKTRVQTHPHAVSHWEVLKTILKEEGLRGLYKGVGFTMVRAVPGSAATFFTYEQISALISKY